MDALVRHMTERVVVIFGGVLYSGKIIEYDSNVIVIRTQPDNEIMVFPTKQVAIKMIS